MYSSWIGLWDPQLGASGERFRHEFQPTQSGIHVGAESAYAAAATEVLLDAIARSDGTRASVVRSLFKTNLADSPVGRVRFDRNGDVLAPPMAILRILGGKGSGYSPVPYYEGARVYSVIGPPAPGVG
jgi:ABC-type branched-subunit amino acid transport system substrate-binding protein